MRQRTMALVGEVKPMEWVPMALIERCSDELEAIQLCIQYGGLYDETVADRLGIDKGHFSRIKNRQAHFPTTKRIALMELCGNRAPLQYEMWRQGIPIPVEDERERKIREIEERMRQQQEELRSLKEAS